MGGHGGRAAQQCQPAFKTNCGGAHRRAVYPRQVGGLLLAECPILDALKETRTSLVELLAGVMKTLPKDLIRRQKRLRQRLYIWHAISSYSRIIASTSSRRCSISARL